MNKRVYKFVKAEHAISNLAMARLKLSTIHDLNDPFDFFAAIDTTDARIATVVQEMFEHYREKIGLLCLSKNWDNLLLWSHYGDSHTGICLGFDISDNRDSEASLDVLYQPNLLQIRCLQDLNFDLVNRLLRTKHECWSYEQEVRMIVGLDDPPDSNGQYWFDFGPLFQLKEVIIGAQCHPTNSKKVAAAIQHYGDAVVCRWAGMRPDAFLLVKQDHPPLWHTDFK